MRSAWTQSPDYQPETSRETHKIAKMFEAAGKERYKECLEIVEDVLDKNYLSLRAHYGGMACAGRSGDAVGMSTHKFMVEGIMNAIATSGDGNTPDTAFFVTNVNEVPDFLKFQKFRIMEGKILKHSDGRYFYLMTVVKPAEPDRVYKMYFDVSAPWNAGQRQQTE